MKTPMRLGLAIALAVGSVGLIGCATEPSGTEAKSNLVQDSNTTLQSFLRTDPSLRNVLDRSAGYAVFPSIGQGGVIIAGGAFGRGVVYDNSGRVLGYCAVRQANVGPQLGGQTYSEMLIFQNQDALNKFRSGTLSFTAAASAVALQAGAAANASFDNGVAVLTKSPSGLMAGAAIGGQQFSFDTMNRE